LLDKPDVGFSGLAGLLIDGCGSQNIVKLQCYKGQHNQKHKQVNSDPSRTVSQRNIDTTQSKKLVYTLDLFALNNQLSYP